MNITDVRVRLINNDESKLKAVATITIDDCFAVHDIKIIQSDDICFVAMPSKKLPSGEFKDIAHPLNSETREMIGNLILEEYRKALEGATENPDEQ